MNTHWNDIGWRDKVSFYDPNDETDAEGPMHGEVIGINHINCMVRFGPGPNDVKCIPRNEAGNWCLLVTEWYEPNALAGHSLHSRDDEHEAR